MTLKFFRLVGLGLLLSSLHATALSAEVAVIVHPSFPGSSLSKADFANLYLGRTRNFPDGSSATPLDLAGGPARDAMLRGLLEKTEEQFVHIWSRLVFSGNSKSMQKLADEKTMVERVANDRTAIGYVDASAVNSSVKVLTIK